MKLGQKIRKLFGLECDAAQREANKLRKQQQKEANELRRQRSQFGDGYSGNPAPRPDKPTPILQISPKQNKINVRL